MDLDEHTDELVALVALAVVATHQSESTISHQTGTPGSQYLMELLSSTPQRIYNVLRMNKQTFYKLCEWLNDNTELKGTWRTSLQEQLAMFLWTVNYSASQRQVAERFQHSGETVHRYVIFSTAFSTRC